MIKNSTYIRKFTNQQRKQLLLVQEQTKLKTVPDILFYTLDNFLSQKADIERLLRIINYKQTKIDNLNLEICQFSTNKIQE